MPRQENSANQPTVVDKKVGERFIIPANIASQTSDFYSVTTISEMGKFYCHILGLMEGAERIRARNVSLMLNEISDHISEATPEAVVTALRTTYYHRAQYQPAWDQLLESAQEHFENREGVDVNSLLTGLHAT
jgi:hypothetical protein